MRRADDPDQDDESREIAKEFLLHVRLLGCGGRAPRVPYAFHVCTLFSRGQYPRPQLMRAGGDQYD